VLFWIDGGDQSQIKNNVEIVKIGYPDVVED
jgi:hypothetical protein